MAGYREGWLRDIDIRLRHIRSFSLNLWVLFWNLYILKFWTVYVEIIEVTILSYDYKLKLA